MSCDHIRGKLFAALAPAVASLVGSEARAAELLDTVYDVAVNQKVRKAGENARAAAAVGMTVRAKQLGFDLAPHTGKDNRYTPESMNAWSEVYGVVLAAERGASFSPLAADTQQVVAWRGLIEDRPRPWNVSMGGATLMQMRRLWASDPERVRLLVSIPEALAGEEHAPFLAELTRLVADDPQAPAPLAAAARYALMLDENGMLDAGSSERQAWAQALAHAAGIGMGDADAGVVPGCPRCGAWPLGYRHVCDPDDIRDAGEVAAAVAEVLASPDFVGDEIQPSPYGQMELLLQEWALTRRPLAGAEARLLALAHRIDRRRMERLARGIAAGDPVAGSTPYDLTAATLRAPVLFDGQPHVWEIGALFRLDDYRAFQEQRRKGVEPSAEELAARAVVQIPQQSLMVLLAGAATTPELERRYVRALRFSDRDAVRRYGRASLPMKDLHDGDLMLGSPCGCVMRCTTLIGKKGGTLHRIATTSYDEDGGGTPVLTVGDARPCAAHGQVMEFTPQHRAAVSIVDRSAPRFDPPSWPAPAASTKEAGRVV